MPPPSRPILAIVVLLAWSAFTVWTVRRLFGSTRERTRPLIYRLGVQGFGLAWWAGMTIVFTLRDPDPRWNIWVRLAVIAFLTFPLGMWAGYSWGQGMGLFFGDRGDDR